MSFRNAILISGVLAIGIAAIGLIGIQPPPIWSERRVAGTSVEGHWYPVGSGGCFADAVVFRIESDREVIVSQGIAVTFGSNLVATLGSGTVTMEMEIPLGKASADAPRQYAPARLEYRDLGSELQMTHFERGGLAAEPAELPVGDLKRCGEYSLWARLSLLWRPAFVPGEADEVADPRRQQ